MDETRPTTPRQRNATQGSLHGDDSSNDQKVAFDSPSIANSGSKTTPLGATTQTQTRKKRELRDLLGRPDVDQRKSAALGQSNDEDEEKFVDDLAPYELERFPRPMIDDVEVKSRVLIRTLNQELSCPICLGLMNNTMMVMDCLHRFCRECINKSLRLGNHECPTCRTKCASKRSLRPDTNMDGLIAAIFPDQDAYEEHMSQIASAIQQNSLAALGEIVEQGMKRQGLTKGAKQPLSKDNTPTTQANSLHVSDVEAANTPRTNQSGSTACFTRQIAKNESTKPENYLDRAIAKQSGSRRPKTPPGTDFDEITVYLAPYPNERQGKPLTHPFLTTSPNLNCGQLRKYLSIKHRSDSKETFDIIIPAVTGDVFMTDDTITLMEMRSLVGFSTTFVIYYRSA